MESIPYPFMEDKELEKEYSMTSDNTEQTQKRIQRGHIYIYTQNPRQQAPLTTSVDLCKQPEGN